MHSRARDSAKATRPTEPPRTAKTKHLLATAARRVLRAHDLEIVQVVPRADHAPEHGLFWPLVGETMVGVRRLSHVQECVRTVVDDGVAGDLIEAGSWRGGITILMRACLEAFSDAERLVSVADSFSGLPKPESEQDSGDKHWAHPEFEVTLDEVRANFARYGLLDDRVRFLPGWFKDTLRKAP